MPNSGIQISGGTVNAKQMVAGSGARAILREEVHEADLSAAVARLEASIAKSDLPVDTVRELLQTAGSVKDETTKAEPRKPVIERALALIEKGAGSVSGVVAAVGAITALLAR